MTTTATTARRAYYVRYPRGFANEYDLRYTVNNKLSTSFALDSSSVA